MSPRPAPFERAKRGNCSTRCEATYFSDWGSPSDVGSNPLENGVRTSLGLPQSLKDVASQRVLQFPRFALSNGAGLGDTGYVDLIENPMAHSFTASLTKVTGHHTIKAGGEYRKLFINFSQYGYADGQFNFDQSWTQQITTSANGTGSPFASFMLGLPDRWPDDA